MCRDVDVYQLTLQSYTCVYIQRHTTKGQVVTLCLQQQQLSLFLSLCQSIGQILPFFLRSNKEQLFSHCRRPTQKEIKNTNPKQKKKEKKLAVAIFKSRGVSAGTGNAGIPRKTGHPDLTHAPHTHTLSLCLFHAVGEWPGGGRECVSIR